MPSILCGFCRGLQQLDTDFFDTANDDGWPPSGPELVFPTIPRIRDSASRGCELCKILANNIREYVWCPPEVLFHCRVRFKRARIGGDRLMEAFLCADDIFVIHFSQVPDSWTSLPYARRGQSVDPTRIMQHWIRICDSEHPGCRHLTVGAGPARALDVAAFPGSLDLRLVDYLTDEERCQLPFVCLSHCWGSFADQPTMTTRLNLAHHMERIPFEELSKTFKDAVTVTRDLGYRYLWIDSLCIIQNDKQDWEMEANRMPFIYGASVLTLAALSAKDGSVGFQMAPVPAKNPKYVDVQFGKQRIRIFEKEPQQWHNAYGDNPFKHEEYGPQPLRQRAWTLQERELPVRKISFSSGMLLWECATSKGSTQLPWRDIVLPDSFKPRLLPMSVSERSEAENELLLRERWFEVVEDYSSRFLTFESDKLPAISGMCSEFSASLKDPTYWVGIWKEQLPSSLLWQTKLDIRRPCHNVLSAFHPRRPMSYRAPSWSWASVDGAVSYRSQRLEGSVSSEPLAEDLDFKNFKVLSGSIVVAGTDPWGATSSARLNIVGRKIVLTCPDSRLRPSPETLSMHHGSRALVAADGSCVGAFYPDVPLSLVFNQEVCCLEVRAEPYYSTDQLPSRMQIPSYPCQEQWRTNRRVMGLALCPVAAPNTYQRIGIFRWVMNKLFEDVAPCEMIVV